MEAKLKQLVVDTITDCLDLPKMEAENLKLTLSFNFADAESALEVARQLSGRT